jgi:hypothetical protein
MRVRELSLRNAILFMRRNGGPWQNATSFVWAMTYRPAAMAARCITRPGELIRVPGAVARAIGWNISDAMARRHWRVPAHGPDLTKP